MQINTTTRSSEVYIVDEYTFVPELLIAPPLCLFCDTSGDVYFLFIGFSIDGGSLFITKQSGSYITLEIFERLIYLMQLHVTATLSGASPLP